jgi:hypothetical protein
MSDFHGLWQAKFQKVNDTSDLKIPELGNSGAILRLPPLSLVRYRALAKRRV